MKGLAAVNCRPYTCFDIGRPMNDKLDFAGWRMTEETLPERPDDPEWRMRWKRRVKWIALVIAPVIALFAAYMSAYYATVAIDVNGLQKRQTYQIWYWELPSLSHGFFAPADWIDDRIHLAPCRNPPVDPVFY
jgi:hypothetical protein